MKLHKDKKMYGNSKNQALICKEQISVLFSQSHWPEKNIQPICKPEKMKIKKQFSFPCNRSVAQHQKSRRQKLYLQ